MYLPKFSMKQSISVSMLQSFFLDNYPFMADIAFKEIKIIICIILNLINIALA